MSLFKSPEKDLEDLLLSARAGETNNSYTDELITERIALRREYFNKQQALIDKLNSMENKDLTRGQTILQILKIQRQNLINSLYDEAPKDMSLKDCEKIAKRLDKLDRYIFQIEKVTPP